MIWGSLILWRVVVALIGAFATAYLHEIKGRNVQLGGLIGLAVGGIGGLFFLLWLWVWIYYFTDSPIGTVYYSRNRVRRWYNWWN